MSPPLLFYFKNMSQPNISARRAYADIVDDMPTVVFIPKTKRHVRLSGMKPYTIERLTRLWIERDLYEDVPKDGNGTLKSMCREPYFAIKEAVLMTLNSYWGIRLFFGLKWRIWAYFRNYEEGQMTPIIEEGKKKLPLMAHWTNMTFSVGMRNDWKKMTKKEAEQYQAELLSVASRLSSKSSQSTEGQEDSSSVQ